MAKTRGLFVYDGEICLGGSMCGRRDYLQMLASLRGQSFLDVDAVTTLERAEDRISFVATPYVFIATHLFERRSLGETYSDKTSLERYLPKIEVLRRIKKANPRLRSVVYCNISEAAANFCRDEHLTEFLRSLKPKDSVRDETTWMLEWVNHNFGKAR